MSLDAINLALTLNDRDFSRRMDSSNRALRDLDKAKFSGVQRGAKAATKELKQMEKQARRTGGLLGKMEGVSRKLRTAGLGLGAAGGVATLSGMFMNWRAKTPAGKPPPIPGTRAAAKAASRAAMGQRLIGIGGKLGTAGLAAGAAGSVVGAIPGIAGLMKGSKGATGAVGGLTGKLNGLTGAAGNAGKSSGKLGSVLGGIGGVGVGLLGGAIAGVGALAAGFTAVATSGLGLNARLEQARAQFEVFTGSVTKADSIIEALKERADITPFETKDYIDGGTALMSAAEGSQEKLMELMKTSEMLTVLNPAEGLAGAAMAIKNAMSGDFVSFQDRFNIDRGMLKRYKEMGLTGQELIRAVLKEMNVTEQSVGKLGKTFTARKSTLISFIDNIRTALSGTLFEWLSEKMAGAVAWIDKNKIWVLDTATGIGMMIGNVVSQVAGWVGKAWTQVYQFGMTLWEFFGNLPARIAASFQDGSLMSAVMDLLGSLMNMAWNGLKFLGKTLWDAIINGVPLLTAIVGKLVIDGLRDALGEKISGMLGLDKLSSTLGDVTSGGASVMKDNFKNNFNEFASSQKAALSDAAATGSALANTLGWGDAKAAAAAGGGPSMGFLAGARQMGANARGQKQVQAAAAQQQEWARANPQVASIANDPGAAEALIRSFMPGGAGKGGRSNGGMRKIQLITQQPMHPVSTY